MKKKWSPGEGTIYETKSEAVLYDCLDDWCSPEGQQVLCDLLNEGHDDKSWEELEPIWRQRMIERAAPDLLAACEALVADYKDYAYLPPSPSYAMARAAIAKAKGSR